MTIQDRLPGSPIINPLTPSAPLQAPLRQTLAPALPISNPAAFQNNQPPIQDLSSPVSLRGLYKSIDAGQAAPAPIPEVEATLAGLLDGDISEGDVRSMGRLLDRLEELEPADRKTFLATLAGKLDQIDQSGGHIEELRDLLKTFAPPQADIKTQFQTLAGRIREHEFSAHQRQLTSMNSDLSALRAEVGSLAGQPADLSQQTKAGLVPRKYADLQTHLSTQLSEVEHDLLEIATAITAAGPAQKGELEAKRAALTELKTGLLALQSQLSQAQELDTGLLKHQTQRFELRGTGVALHKAAADVFKGSAPAETRLEKIDEIKTQYLDLGAKFAGELSALDADLAKIEGLIAADPKPELITRRDQLLQQKSALTGLQVDFALAESLDAIEISKADNFGGLRVSIQHGSRADLLAAASANLTGASQALSTEITRLKALPGQEQRINELETRLKSLAATATKVTAASGELSVGVAKANAAASQRSLILDSMVSQIDSLMRAAGPDDLIALALSTDPNISGPAQKDLAKLKDAIVDVIKTEKAKYASWGPGSKPLKMLDDLMGQLNAYQFDKLPELLKAGKSLKDQVDPFTRDINAALKKMEGSILYRSSEIRKLGAVNQAATGAFQSADLAQKAIDGNRLTELGQDVAGISLQVQEMAALSERLLENPDQNPEVLKDKREQIGETLRQLGEAYYNNLATAPGDKQGDYSLAAEAKASPEIEALELMQKRTRALQLGANDVKTYDTQLEALFKHKIPPGTADYKQLLKLYAVLKTMDVAMDYPKRELAVAPTQEAAYAKARELAEAAQSKAVKDGKTDAGVFFGIIDKGVKDGKHQGYAIVQYPGGDDNYWNSKYTQASHPGSSLLEVVALHGDEWFEGGRLILPLEPGTSIETEGMTGLAMYQDAIDHYSRYDDPKVLAGSLMKMIDTAYANAPSELSIPERERYVDRQIAAYLDTVFNLQDSESGVDTIGVATAEFKKLYKAYAEKQSQGFEGKYVLEELQQTASFKKIQTSVNQRSGVSSLENASINAIGEQAQIMVAQQYKQAIDSYSSFASQPDELLLTLMSIGSKGAAEGDALLKQMFDVPGAGAQLRGNWVAYQLALSKGDKAGAAKVLADLKKTPLFGDIQAGAKARLKTLNKAREEVLAMQPRQAAFKLAQQFVDVRKEIYKCYQIPFDPKKPFPPSSDPAELAKTDFKLSTGKLYCQQAENWDDSETVSAIASTAGIITGTIALGLISGGMGAGVAMGVMVTTSVGMAGYQIYEAEAGADTARANYSAGLGGYGAVTQADKTVTLSYVSAVVQVLTAGGSFGAAKLINPQTLKAAMGTDLVMSTLSTLVDPLTWQGDFKSIAINLAVGGVATFASNGAGAALEGRLGHPVGTDPVEVIFSKDRSRIFTRGKDGVEVDLLPIKVEGDKATFRFEGDDGKHYQFELQIEKGQLSQAPPAVAANAIPAARSKDPPPVSPKPTPPAIDPSAAGTPVQSKPRVETDLTLKISGPEQNKLFFDEKWQVTDQPGVYRKPDGTTVKVEIQRPPQAPSQVKATIDKEIAKLEIIISKGTPAEVERAKTILDGLKILRDTDALSIDLCHSTNTMMLDGLEKSGGVMLSAKKLREQDIARTTGEGDTFSGASGDKTDIFVGYGVEGLGTTMAYYKLAAQAEHYNLSLMKDADLSAEIAKVQHLVDNFDKIPDFLINSPVIPGKQDKTQLESRLRSLLAEQTKRATYPPELLAKEKPYPIMFSMAQDDLSVKQLPNSQGGLVDEAVVANQIDLKETLRAVFVPADKMAETKARLAKIFGENNQIKIIPFEALELTIKSPSMEKAVKTYDNTYDGMGRQSKTVAEWYEYAKAMMPTE